MRAWFNDALSLLTLMHAWQVSSSKRLCLQHSHPVTELSSTRAADGNDHILKQYSRQLTPAERKLFVDWAGVHLDIVKMEDLLMRGNPGCQYEYQLLYREKLRAEKQHRQGKSQADMSDFMSQGNAITAKGGIFVTKVDDTQRLYATYRQTDMNKAYLQAYGEYLCMDGTHWVDKYGDVLVIGTVVDCLGRTQNGFSIISPGEDGEMMKDAMDKFAVGKGGTLHTDGAAWGAMLAEIYERDHQLCSDHYITKAPKLAADLGDEDESFQKLTSGFLHEHYRDQDALDEAIKAAERR